MIVLGLVQNIALLVTLSFVQQLILRYWDRHRPGYRMLSGLLYGSIAVAGMMMSIAFAPGIVFDGRSIVLAVGGLFGGPVVAAIAATMAAAYRIHLGGAGVVMGVSVIVTAAGLGTVAYYLRQRHPRLVRPAALWVFGLVVHGVMLALTSTLPGGAWRQVLPAIALPVAVVYPVAVMVIARLMLDGEERLTAEAALRKSEERLRAIIEQTDQGVTVGRPDGAIELYNPAMTRLSGYTREEVEEHGWFELAYPDTEERAAALRIAGEAMRGLKPYVEMPITRKDGEKCWISFATSPVTLDGETYNLSILTDTTEQRNAEERLRELEEIVSRSPAVAFTWENSPGWPVRFVSRSIKQYALDAETLMTRRTLYSELMHPEDVPRIEREVRAFLGQGVHEFQAEYRLRTGDGAYRWVAEHTWVTPGRASEDPETFQGVLVDVHDRKLAELELLRHRSHLEELVEERTGELMRVNEELATASDAKSQLLANVSHELRTPMNSIIGFSGILSQGLAGPLNEEQERQVAMISRSGRQLLTLINDVLDLSRAEAGRVSLDLRWFDPHKLVLDVAATLAPLGEEKGLELQVSAEPLDGQIRSDPDRVTQVLLNLAGNAVKFTSGGVISIGVEPTASGGAKFIVTDSGPGIPLDEREHIFEAFTQIDPPDHAKPTGTGLGLAISREYARTLGGEVTLTSEVGIGSTFTLVLPRDTGSGKANRSESP